MKSLFAVFISTMLAARLFGAEEEPAGSFQKHELAQAACFAVSNGNIPLMKALVQAGLPIDEPLYADDKGSPGWTALHICCVHNQPAMMKWLIKRGANRNKRDMHNARPIDMAFEKGNKALCELLAIPKTNERTVNGIPRSLFQELVRPHLSQRELPLFVSINGKDPDGIVQDLMSAWGIRRNLASQVEEYQEGDKRGYRHKESKTIGELVEIVITNEDPFDPSAYSWSIRRRTGPALAGGGSRGKVAMLYGYWLVTESQSWDE